MSAATAQHGTADYIYAIGYRQEMTPPQDATIKRACPPSISSPPRHVGRVAELFIVFALHRHVKLRQQQTTQQEK